MTQAETILAAVIFVGVPLAVMVWEFRQYDLTLKLRQVGLRARAEVLHTEWASDRDYLEVKYVLHLQDGSELHGEYRHHPTQKPYPAVGDTLEALYLPDAPRRHQVVGAEGGLARLLVNVVGMGLFIALAVHLLLLHHRKQQAPEANGATPSSRLRTYEEPPPPSKPPSNGHRRMSAY